MSVCLSEVWVSLGHDSSKYDFFYRMTGVELIMNTHVFYCNSNIQ